MKKLLVALDHSPRAARILERAAALVAGHPDAELFLMRAVGLPVELPHEAYRASPDDVTAILKTNATRELERFAASLDPKRVVHILVRVGAPWSAICESAKAHDVDLIVIGSHGYDAIDHILGTTAAKVVNHADRSVYVVRDPARPAK